MISRWHNLFVEAGYPDCDAVFHEDGSWSIRQYHSAPVIPSLTKWSWVLTDIRHSEISVGFIKRYLDKLSPTRGEFFADQEKATEEVTAEAEALEIHQAEMVSKAKAVVLKNEALVDRIAKNGIGEMDLENIAKHIPSGKL